MEPLDQGLTRDKQTSTGRELPADLTEARNQRTQTVRPRKETPTENIHHRGDTNGLCSEEKRLLN